MSYRDRDDFARETSEWYRLLRGMVRRVVVIGGDEVWPVEPFTGIGFYSRPPSSGKPEAITVAMGGSKTTAIVATRDEATRKVGAGDLESGETCVYNDRARIIVKANGSAEIRLHGGVALPLPTMADHNALRDWIHTAMVVKPGVGWPPPPPPPPAPAPAPGTTNVPPSAAGTIVLKAQ